MPKIYKAYLEKSNRETKIDKKPTFWSVDSYEIEVHLTNSKSYANLKDLQINATVLMINKDGETFSFKLEDFKKDVELPHEVSDYVLDLFIELYSEWITIIFPTFSEDVCQPLTIDDVSERFIKYYID